MDKLIIDSHGRAIEWDGSNRREDVRFPVCLAVEFEGRRMEGCADFILNISKTGVFVMTKEPFEKGTRVLLSFLIPPEERLLSRFEGVVVAVNTEDKRFPKGMHIKFLEARPGDLKRLEEYLEGRRHLVDVEA